MVSGHGGELCVSDSKLYLVTAGSNNSITDKISSLACFLQTFSTLQHNAKTFSGSWNGKVVGWNTKTEAQCSSNLAIVQYNS